MSLNPRLQDPHRKIPEPQTGGGYDQPAKGFEQTRSGWSLTTVAPKGPPAWINERIVVVCDNMFEEDEEYEYHVIEYGKYIDKFNYVDALRAVNRCGVLMPRAIELLSYAAAWCCASLDHRGNGELLGDRWNLASIMPAKEWRKFAIGWKWVETPIPQGRYGA